MIRGDNSRTARALGWFPVSMSFAGFDRVSLLNRHHYRHRAHGLASLSSSRLTRSRSTCSSTSSARRPPAGRRAGRRGRRGRRLRCAVRELGRAAVGRNRRRGHDLAGRDAHVERHRERRIAAGVRRHVVLRADELLALAVARGVASGGSRGRTIASSPVVWGRSRHKPGNSDISANIGPCAPTLPPQPPARAGHTTPKRHSPTRNVASNSVLSGALARPRAAVDHAGILGQSGR